MSCWSTPLALVLASVLTTPAHAQEATEALTFVFAPVQQAGAQQADLHRVYIDPELLELHGETPAGALIDALVEEASQAGGCVAMTQDAAQAVTEQVSCGGGTVTRERNPLAGVFEPTIPEISDPAAQDGCSNTDACSKRWPKPTDGVVVEVDNDNNWNVGVRVGGRQIMSDALLDAWSDVTTHEVDDELLIMFDNGWMTPVEMTPADSGVDDPQMLVDAVLSVLSDLLGAGDDEAPAEDSPAEGEEDPPTQAPEEQGSPVGDSAVPVECEEAMADAIPDWGDGHSDPSPVDGVVEGEVYMGCFVGTDLVDQITDCSTDHEANPGPGGASLCVTESVALDLPLLTKDDLLIDPSPEDDVPLGLLHGQP